MSPEGYMGYVSSGVWKTYTDNTGNFYLGGSTAPTTGSEGWLGWDSGDNKLTIKVT